MIIIFSVIIMKNFIYLLNNILIIKMYTKLVDTKLFPKIEEITTHIA